MAEQVPTTKLEAVNTMMELIGERPVNDITTTSPRLDVEAAKRALAEASKRVQIKGWWFNSPECITLPVDGNGEYLLPDEILKADLSTKFTTSKFVQRGRKMYDLGTRRFGPFTDDLTVDYIEEVTFDDLPESAKWAVSTTATVLFAQRRVGSRELLAEARTNQRDAWIDLRTEQTEAADHSMLKNPELARVLDR